MNGLYAIHFSKQKPPVVMPPNISTGMKRAQRGNRPALYPPPSMGLSGILDDLKALAQPYVSSAGAKLKQQFQNQLDSAQIKLENEIGQFLTTGQTLTDLYNRAQAQTGSAKPEVKTRAVAVAAKANALLNNYAAIKTDAMNTVAKLSALKNQLSTSEIFKTDNPLGMGTRIVELFNQYKSQLASTLSNSVSVGSRMAAHIQETKDLSKDVESLESYAQGKGWTSALSTIGDTYLNTTSSIAKIAAVGLLVYFLAPSFIGRVARKA